MIERYGLGIDLGTSKISAVLISARERRVVEAVSLGNDASLPDLAEGSHEQSPFRIIELAAQACRKLMKNAGIARELLAGIGVTGQMHGVMLVGNDLCPATPLITWRDQRAAGEFLAELRDSAGSDYSSRTGYKLQYGYGGVTLAWLLRYGAIAFPGGYKAVSISDYLVACLTGVIATGASHAASWGIFDLRENCWDRSLLKALKIPAAVLPEVKHDSEPVGICTTSAADEFDLLAGGPVGLAIGDNQASVYAATDGKENCLVFNLGTGGQVSLPVTEVQCGGGCETRPGCAGLSHLNKIARLNLKVFLDMTLGDFQKNPVSAYAYVYC